MGAHPPDAVRHGHALYSSQRGRLSCMRLRHAMTSRPSRGSFPIQSLSWIELAYCCIVVVVAYAARGSTGFGAAAAMPLLGLVIPLKILIPAWTLIGLAAGVTLLGRDRKNIAWRDMTGLLPSCMIGIA